MVINTNNLKDTTVQIFNVQGQEVKTFTMTANNNRYSITDLSAGTYFVKIGTEIQKIIVSK